MPDAQAILTPLKIPDSVKADAWDAVQNATGPDDLTARLKKLPLSDSVRADLWDSRPTFTVDVNGNQPPPPKTLGGFLKNVAGSAGHLAANLGQAIIHPIDTVKNAADIVAGGVNALTGATAADKNDPAYAGSSEAESDAKFQAFLGDLKKRYGSIDNFGETLYKDPVGVLADLSTASGGIEGAASRAADLADAAKLAGTASAARKIATVAETVSKATNPVSAVTQPAARITDVSGGPIARRLYASALKPNGGAEIPEMRQMVETGLREGINPGDQASYEKLNGLISDVQQKISDQVKARTGAPVIDPEDVAARVGQVRPQFETVNPVKNMRDIDTAKQEFLAQFQQPQPQASGLVGPNGQPIPAPPAPPASKMTLAEAQDMKTKTGPQLAKDYGQLSNATAEAQKALVRGLKEEIENVFPEIAAANQREAEFLNLKPSLEAAVKRVMKSDLIPSGSGDKVTLVKKILDVPRVKAGIAIALEKAPDFAPSKGVTVGQRAALVSSRLGDYLDRISAAAPPQSGPPAPEP